MKVHCELCRGQLEMSKGTVGRSEEIFGRAIPYVSFTCQNPDCGQGHCYGLMGHTTAVARFGGSWRDRWREMALDNAMRFVGGLRSRRDFWKRRVHIWWQIALLPLRAVAESRSQ